jgi:hypothetical protein
LSQDPSFFGGANSRWYVAPQEHILRPVILLTNEFSSTSMNTTASSLRMLWSAFAWLTDRGYPSRMYPLAQSGAESLFFMMFRTSESGTSWPLSIYPLASAPRGDPFFTSARRRSPVEIWGIENLSVTKAACVPFPAPGGPKRAIFM